MAANAEDVARAREAGTPESTIDRLSLTAERVTAIADAVRDIVDLPDPVGEVVRGFTLPNGLQVRQVRVPLGVIGMIYEARPNVTVDAAALCLKSGNVALLRGSSSAYAPTRPSSRCCRTPSSASACRADVVQLVPGLSRESVKHLMTARGLVDVLIPRGGAGLIRSVVEESTVPAIETGVGNCHVYVDERADLDMALASSSTPRPSAPASATPRRRSSCTPRSPTSSCPRALDALHGAGVTVHGDERVAGAAGPAFEPATDEDWETEYLSFDIAAGVVDSLDEAMSTYPDGGSGHTEAIVTDAESAAHRFVAEVDSAAVMVNASTRFTDGGEFGFGAEIGISTQKLHARGPMGLPELTSTTYVVTGEGQVRD